MAAPRTKRYSRPAVLCSAGCGLRGVRDGIAPTPFPKGSASGTSGLDLYVAPSGGVAVVQNAAPSGAVQFQFDFARVSFTYRIVVTATTGVAPPVIVRINNGSTLTSNPNTIQPTDVVQIGIRPPISTAGTGTITIQNRPDLGSFAYSFTI